MCEWIISITSSSHYRTLASFEVLIAVDVDVCVNISLPF